MYELKEPPRELLLHKTDGACVHEHSSRLYRQKCFDNAPREPAVRGLSGKRNCKCHISAGGIQLPTGLVSGWEQAAADRPLRACSCVSGHLVRSGTQKHRGEKPTSEHLLQSCHGCLCACCLHLFSAPHAPVEIFIWIYLQTGLWLSWWCTKETLIN